MSKVEVNQVTQQCGTTLTVGGGACKTAVVDATTVTLGRCGGTVSLASGATQSGFGREGSVDWQTGSIKTAGFTPTNGEGYFCDTSGGAFAVTLPAGSAGNIVAFADYTRTFNSNNLTITPNGAETIGGVNADAALDVDGQSATFVYVDGTEGWINIQETQTSVAGVNPYVTATVSGVGNTLTTVCTNYKVAKFIGPGTFCVSSGGTAAPGSGTGSNLVDYMVVAAGGGSGGSYSHISGGGGGGAGGFKESPGTASGCYTVSPRGAAPAVSLSVPIQAYPITVGGGGTGGTKSGGGGAAGPNVQATSGANSIFSSITSAGGGFGGQGGAPSGKTPAGAGGSGGGGGGPSGSAGAGNTPPSNPVQGMAGGAGAPGGATLGASGGGATGAGSASPNCGTTPSNPSRGTGATTNISASPVVYATGGRFNCYTSPASTPIPVVGNATDNTGNGACAQNASNPGPYMPDPGAFTGVNGASGVVIIRYKFQN